MNSSSYRSVYENSKVINHTFPVKEVVWSYQKVPGKRSKPRQVVNTVHWVANINDLLKAFDLNNECLPKIKNEYKYKI